ncbi:interleukin-18 receptor accessory protein-like isoform X2 [Heterodontus francisci]|uniref:interleukin-18 receptor accessory protein-like isoform X2 n=1 Tax=Heterodontus francisci TaxID=7792 RepID=UPI00355BF37F
MEKQQKRMIKNFWMLIFAFTTSESMGGKTISYPLDSSKYPDCFAKAPQSYFIAFVGDPFELACEPDNLTNDNSMYYANESLWYRQDKEGNSEQINGWSEVISQRGKNFSFSSISTADSGTYLCFLRNAGLCFKVYILVVQMLNQRGCQDAGNCEVLLIRNTADIISCPGIQHFNASASFPVKWYKNKKVVEEYIERISLKIKNGQIHLNRIYESDSGNYTCTFKFIENNNTWIVKRTFTVRVVVDDTRKTPTVIDPHGVKTIEVELGQSVQLMCKVYFGYERKFSPVIKWLTNGKDLTENMRLQQDEVLETKTIERYILIRKANLSTVTKEDFSTNFTCFSQNSQGNSSGVLRLKEKDGEEFDAFVSYANASSLEEDDEGDNYITEERFSLELLPSVLEKQYGYKLCLFERDVLPGGVYTEDVISCIKRSRRVIIVLSPNYVARNGSRIFELQTGVDSMLDNFKTKVILIKFRSLPDITDFPQNVKKAITVLPQIPWKGNKSSPPTSKFWKMLRYYMPVKKNELCEKSKLQLTAAV